MEEDNPPSLVPKRPEEIEKRIRTACATTDASSANAKATIDRRCGKRFLRIEREDVVTTRFYGLAQKFDLRGKYLGLNSENGENGVMFITSNKVDALYYITSISTGISLDVLQDMTLPNSGSRPSF